MAVTRATSEPALVLHKQEPVGSGPCGSRRGMGAGSGRYDQARTQIVDIKTFPTWVGSRNQLIVKVETDEGVSGLGESGVSGRELAVVGAIQHFRQFLRGKDPLRRGALWQEMYRSQYFEG